MLGIGVDLVHVPGFAVQLAQPGSRFAEPAVVFTTRELRVAGRRGGPSGSPGRARHLAGRWAVKESVVKAWSQALYGRPPVLPPDEMRWTDIEVVADAWGRVDVRLHGRVAAAVGTSLAPVGEVAWRASLSHDGDYAYAEVLLVRV